jgi:hypothetical protein
VLSGLPIEQTWSRTLEKLIVMFNNILFASVNVSEFFDKSGNWKILQAGTA